MSLKEREEIESARAEGDESRNEAHDANSLESLSLLPQLLRLSLPSLLLQPSESVPHSGLKLVSLIGGGELEEDGSLLVGREHASKSVEVTFEDVHGFLSGSTSEFGGIDDKKPGEKKGGEDELRVSQGDGGREKKKRKRDSPSSRRVLLSRTHGLDSSSLKSNLQGNQLLDNLVLLLLSSFGSRVASLPLDLLILLGLDRLLLNLSFRLLLVRLRSSKESLELGSETLDDLRSFENGGSIDDLNHSGIGELDGDSDDGIGVESEFGFGEVGKGLSETGDLGGVDFAGEGAI